MRPIFRSRSPAQTRKIGEILAGEILKTPFSKKAFILGLEGDLGGGKTTFLQGVAKGLGIKQKILSPTFIIMRKFPISNSLTVPTQQFLNFYHFDCYRIEKLKEILDLDFKKSISEPQNIVAIEWAEKIKKIIPKKTIWIRFEFINQKTRKITIFLRNDN